MSVEQVLRDPKDYRVKYPAIEPFNKGLLDVGNGHKIYFEECGNPSGKPVVFLHGGPGGGCDESHRCYFDPSVYRIVLFDQRGCGRSLPFAELNHNTTWDLVSDIEKIRNHLGIKKWLVFGGSWGSTLALAYAIKHTEQVKGLVLRGIFLCRPKEIYWFYQFGASHLFPDAWEKFLAPIPEDERGDMVSAYYERLISNDEEEKLEAARAWSIWEATLCRLVTDPKDIEAMTEPVKALPFARIECHYFINNAFMETNNWIIDNSYCLSNTPITIVHGRYDVVCPMESAWDLHKALPHAELKIIPVAGHSASEAAVTDELVRATDKYRDL
jgi:proline iminopeptidase